MVQTRRILRDSTGRYWSDTDIIAYVNQAMQQRDRDSGQSRLVQTVNLVVNQNLYTYPTAATADVYGIVVIFGNTRYRIGERPYSEASSIYQPTTTYIGLPQVFAKFGANKVYIAPKPSQAYVSEWDTLIISSALVNTSDTDPLPYPWTDPIPYLAAFFARLALQQYEEAQQHKQTYDMRMSEIAGGVRGMYIPNPYPTSGNRL